MKLILVVPCYNEEAVLAETTRQLSLILDELKEKQRIDEGCILYVNDGSKDRTWELIEQFAQQNDYVEGLKLAHNVGHQHALWAGLEWAADRGDAIVTIDADLQDDVRAIIDMTEAYLRGNEVVFGVRRERNRLPYYRHSASQQNR